MELIRQSNPTLIPVARWDDSTQDDIFKLQKAIQCSLPATLSPNTLKNE